MAVAHSRDTVVQHGALRRCDLLSPSEAMMPCKVTCGAAEEDVGYKMRIVSIRQMELSRLTSMDTETPSDTAMRQSPSCASEDNQINLRRLTEIQDDFFRRLAEHQEEFLRSFISTQADMYHVLNTEMRNHNGKRPFPSSQSDAGADDVEKYHDQDLVAWLKGQEFPDDTIRKIIREEFTLEDFHKSVTKEDLRDIGLKIGPRCRLWDCITRLQQRPHSQMNGNTLDCHTNR